MIVSSIQITEFARVYSLSADVARLEPASSWRRPAPSGINEGTWMDEFEGEDRS